MQCSCGYDNPPGSKFCVKCGTPVTVTPVIGPVPPVAGPVQSPPRGTGKPPISSRTALIAVGAFTAILAVAGILAWLLTRPMGQYRQDNGGLYRILENGKYGYMDRTGHTVIRPQFDDALDFSEGLAMVRIGNKAGFISTTGKIVITPQFDDAQSFVYGRAAVKLCCGLLKDRNFGDKCGFIDRDGKYVAAPDFLSVGFFSGSRSGDVAPVKFPEGGFGFVSRSGKVVIPGPFEALTINGFQGGVAAARSGGKWGYINRAGKWAIDPQFDEALGFVEGLAGVSVSNKWGYIDTRGKFVVNPQFDMAYSFDNGTAPVRTGAAWSLIDAKGDPLPGPPFLELSLDNNQGLRAARTKDGWGYVRGASFVVRPIFDAAEPFMGELARVTIGDRELYVDKTGAYVGEWFKGRSIRPAQAVQEIWEGEVTGPDWKDREKFLFSREGATIKGYYVADGSETDLLGTYFELAADVKPDDSVHMDCATTAIWNGRFLAPFLIAGTKLDPTRSPSQEFPFRLHFVREATPADLPAPLPSTSPDWNVFFDKFKETMAQRGEPALAAMIGRTFYFQNATLHSMQDVFRQLDWQQMDKTLKDGEVRETKNPLGRQVRFVTDLHPCPTCTFQAHLAFLQEADGQWRWVGIVYLNN